MITRAPRIPKKFQTFILGAFIDDLTATQAASQADKRWRIPPGRKHVISRPCVNNWYRHFREKIYMSTRHAPRFSGDVEIDLGYFGGRNAKKTSDIVRRLAGLPPTTIAMHKKFSLMAERKKTYILGMLQRGGDVYFHPVKRKDRISLESAIRLVVEKGSTIYSDKEPALSKLRLDGYKHQSVNHSIGYATKEGIHINGIESCFREARASMGKNFRGVRKSTIMLHIKEREFRYNHKHDLARELKRLL